MPKCFLCKTTRDKDQFTQIQLKTVCRLEVNDDCIPKLGLYLVGRERKKKEQAEKKHFRERKAELNNTVSYWRKKAQPAFNWFIRERDFLLPCVSCGRFDHEIKYSGVGGKFDAGHLRTRGAHPELRFCEDNCFKQCKKCNGGSGRFSRKDAMVADKFKAEVLERIGPDRYEWLMGPHEPKRYRVEELKEITKMYNQKARILVRKRGG